MLQRIVIRNGNADEWAEANPILFKGEIGLEIEEDSQDRRGKIGDGVTAWNDLEYTIGDLPILEGFTALAFDITTGELRITSGAQSFYCQMFPV